MIGLAWRVLEVACHEQQPILGRRERTIRVDREAARRAGLPVIVHSCICAWNAASKDGMIAVNFSSARLVNSRTWFDGLVSSA